LAKRRIAISREWLLRLLKCIDVGGDQDELPQDSKIVDAEYDTSQRTFNLTVESEVWKEVRQNDLEVIPYLKVYGN